MHPVTCPTCRTVAAWDDNPFRPFCSERCRLQDLGCWLREEYAVEVLEEDDFGDDGDPTNGA